MGCTKMELNAEKIVSAQNLLGLVLAISVSVPILDSVSVGPAVIRQLDILFLLLGIYVVAHTQEYQFPNQSVKMLLPLIGILIYGIIIIPFQQFSVSNSLVELIQLVEIILIFLTLYQILSDEVVDQILYTIFVITIVCSALSIPYYLFTNNRFVGVWFIAGIPPFALFYGLSSYVDTRSWFAGIGVLLITIRIVLARSRSVWLLLPVAGILAIVIANRGSMSKEKVRTFSGISLAGLLTILPIVAVLPDLRRRFVSVVSGSQGLFARPVRYLSGIQALENYPFGVGLANYGVALQEMAKSDILAFPQWFRGIAGDWIIRRQLEKFRVGKGGPHSDLFKFLIETGLVGVSLFIMFWIMVLRSLMTGKEYRYRTAIQATIIYYGFQSMVNSILLAGGGVTLILFLCIDIYKSKRGLGYSS